MTMSSAKAAEPIVMLSGMLTRVCLRNHLLGPYQTGKLLESFFRKSLSKVYFRKKTFRCERSTFESLSLSKVTFTK